MSGVDELFLKDWIVNISIFVCHTISVSATQLCYYHARATEQYANQWVWLCFNKTVFTKIEGGQDLVCGP